MKIVAGELKTTWKPDKVFFRSCFWYVYARQLDILIHDEGEVGQAIDEEKAEASKSSNVYFIFFQKIKRFS